MLCGGAGPSRSRASRDAIPKPTSRTLPALSTNTFSGLTSLWIRPRLWTWPSATARLMARPRNRGQLEGLLPFPIQNAVERVTAGVGKNKDGLPFVTRERERLGGPRGLKLRGERIFMLEASQVLA